MNIIIRLISSKYFIAAILLVLLAIGAVKLHGFCRKLAISRIRYSRSFSDDGVFESEGTVLTETIRNPLPIPVFFVDVEAYIPSELTLESYAYSNKKQMQYFFSRFHLLPFMQIKRRHTIRCPKRGAYSLESVNIIIGKGSRYIDAPAQLLVYPKIIEPEGSAIPPGSYIGDFLSLRRLIVDPFSFSGIRDYRAGDPVSSINFKATARSAHTLFPIKVNERDFSADRKLMVFINFSLLPGEAVPTAIYEQAAEEALQASAALIRTAFEQGFRFGFAANCRLTNGAMQVSFPPDGGEPHFKEILGEMARIRPCEGVSIHRLLENAAANNLRDAEIFFITPYTDIGTDELLDSLKRNGNTVKTIVMHFEDEITK